MIITIESDELIWKQLFDLYLATADFINSDAAKSNPNVSDCSKHIKLHAPING